MSRAIYFTSPPRQIGRHEWRAIVVDSRFSFGGRVVDYEFRRLGDLPIWRNCREWPGYDADNGQTAGLPVAIARLYDQHRTAIQAACITSAPRTERIDAAAHV